MKQLLVIAGVLVLLGCSKNDNFGRAELLVQLELAEFSSGTILHPENAKIFIRKENEAGYLFERLSDDEGFALFTVLKEGETYEIYCQFEKDGIPYTGSQLVEILKENEEAILRLNPLTVDFNLLSVKCSDYQNDGIPNVNVCLFLSRTLADSADCNFSTYSQQTNNFGKTNFWNLEEGRYYIGIRDTIGGYWVNFLDSVDILSGSQQKELILIQ